MMEEMLVRVDENDNKTGLEEKVKCHQLNGLLHRAFTALIFDSNGRLCLCKRSDSKMLWPGDWDGTFASHPMDNESYVDSGVRRMPDEIGAVCSLDYVNKFEYHVRYKNIGSENEICATLIGVIEDSSLINPISTEVSKVEWVTAEKMRSLLAKDVASYCPWMIIAMYFMQDSDASIIDDKYSTVLQDWIGDDIRAELLVAVEKHIPKDKWRLVK